MKLNAPFHRKETQFEPEACVVEKIIELDPGEYAAFRRGMLQDQPFIAENNNFVRMTSDNTLHCLLVLGEGYDDGILVDSEGADYARRAAFIPGARQLLAVEEQRAEQAFTEQMGNVPGADLSKAPAWAEHARALAESDTGAYGPTVHNEYIRSLQKLGDAFRRVDRLFAGIAAEIFNRQEFCRPDQLLPAADNIHSHGDMEKYLHYARSGYFDPLSYAVDKIIEDGLRFEADGVIHHGYAEIQDAYGLDANQMPQLFEGLEGCKEVGELLIYDNRAAFTLCFRPQVLGQDMPEQAQPPLDQEDLTAIYARHLLWELEQPDGVQADFSGRVLSGLDFGGMSFCGAIFTGATIHQCRMGQASFDNSDFTGAKLRGVTACEADFRGADFRGATLEYCEFAESQLDGADFSQAELVECDGLDGIAQGPVMRMGD